jgi:hypothetical protein
MLGMIAWLLTLAGLCMIIGTIATGGSLRPRDMDELTSRFLSIGTFLLLVAGAICAYLAFRFYA